MSEPNRGSHLVHTLLGSVFAGSGLLVAWQFGAQAFAAVSFGYIGMFVLTAAVVRGGPLLGEPCESVSDSTPCRRRKGHLGPHEGQDWKRGGYSRSWPRAKDGGSGE